MLIKYQNKSAPLPILGTASHLLLAVDQTTRSGVNLLFTNHGQNSFVKSAIGILATIYRWPINSIALSLVSEAARQIKMRFDAHFVLTSRGAVIALGPQFGVL